MLVKNVDTEKEQFRTKAKAYRGWSKKVNCAALCILISGVIAYAVPSIRGYAITAGAIGLVLLGIAQVSIPKLTCWSCGKDVDGIAEDFCPSCGFGEMKAQSAFGVHECNRCRTAMLRPKGNRRYKVSYCTRCGTHLTDDPL